MKSRQLIAAVVLLVVLGEGYWWIARRSARPEARATPTIEPSDSKIATADPAAALPIPEPAPPAGVEVATNPISDESLRAAAVAPPVQKFESKYRGKTADELRAANETLIAELSAASTARFAELFPQFPQLLAESRYGARIAPTEEPIHIKNTPGGRVLFYEQTMVRNAAGVDETHCLELCPAEEPTMAALFEESVWVRAQLLTLQKKG